MTASGNSKPGGVELLCCSTTLLPLAAISPARRVDFTRREPDFTLPNGQNFTF